jgi:hypothetical protein
VFIREDFVKVKQAFQKRIDGGIVVGTRKDISNKERNIKRASFAQFICAKDACFEFNFRQSTLLQQPCQSLTLTKIEKW